MADDPTVIQREIEKTREQMGATVDALGHKANVPARTREWVSDKKDDVVSTLTGLTPDGELVKHRSLRLKDTAERNPLGLALAGAAIGLIAGLVSPPTRIEDEKIGPISDDLKSTAVEVGKEAVEHGRQVADATAKRAADTATSETKKHGGELSESLQDKARDIGQASHSAIET
jgi:uncharacterized protein DUF3618